MFSLVCVAAFLACGLLLTCLATGGLAFLILWGVSDVLSTFFLRELASCPVGMDLTSNLPGVGMADLDDLTSFFFSVVVWRLGLPFSLRDSMTSSATTWPK